MKEKTELFVKLMSFMGKRKWKYIFCLMGTCFVYTIVQIFASLATKEFVNYFLISDEKTIFRAIIYIVSAIISTSIIYPVLTYKYHIYVKETIVDIRYKLFSHIQMLPQKFFDTNQSGDILARTNNDILIVENIYGNYLDCILTALIWGGGTTIVMFKLDVGLALFIVGFGAIYLWINIRYSKKIEKDATQKQIFTSNISNKLVDILYGYEILKVLNLGEKLFDKYNKENILLKKSSLDLAEKNSQLAVISFVINLFSTFGVIILGSIFFAFDLIDYGSVIAAVTLQTGITYMFLNLGTYINQMQVALVSAKRVMEIFDEKQENVAIEEKQIGFFPIRNSGIEYRNVSFVYNEKKVIDNLSLKISCGEKIAIVGASGSGKSTILKLLLRIYEVDNGEILMNGKNVSGMTCSDVRAAIAYVPQEPYIFHSSIYSNIDCMGKCSTEEFKKIVHLAAVDEFVDSMPKKYDSIVGGGVTKLSGGEKQRIGIARAWCKKSPIYLFDEATSALDYISEEKVMSQFMEENKESTVIMVTHRFSTLKYFDRILVIKNGNLEEECDYNAIVKRNIIYSDFLTSE